MPADAVLDQGLPARPGCRTRQTRLRQKMRAPRRECGRAPPVDRAVERDDPVATRIASFRRPRCGPAAHSASPAVCQLVGSRREPHLILLFPRFSDMKINAIDIKPGNVLEHQNKLWIVMKRELVQPGKGGSFAQVEMRDLRGGNKTSERFRTQETVERVRLDEKEMQFLYMKGDHATFMDNDSFEQVQVPREMIGDPADFLADSMICTVMLYEGTPLSVDMPQSVTMEVVEADPVVRGQTASSSYKPGKLENGRRVMIPPYIIAGATVVRITPVGLFILART